MRFTVSLWIGIFLAYFPAALVHELGHYLVGSLLGGKGAYIRFGDPNARPAFRLNLYLFELRVHLGLGLWLVHAWCQFSTIRMDRPWRRILFCLGGPAASALLLLALMPGDLPGLLWARSSWTWQETLAWWSFWLTVMPLLPTTYRDGSPSDGLQIFRALRRTA